MKSDSTPSASQMAPHVYTQPLYSDSECLTQPACKNLLVEMRDLLQVPLPAWSGTWRLLGKQEELGVAHLALESPSLTNCSGLVLSCGAAGKPAGRGWLGKQHFPPASPQIQTL